MPNVSFRQKDFMYSSNSPKAPSFKMHLHEYYEFLYFISGEATYMVEDTEYSASAGDLFITRPHELHAIVFKSGVKYVRKFFQISSALLSNIEIDLLKFIDVRPLGEFNKIEKAVVEEHNLKKYFEDMEYYVVNRLPESDIMIRTYVIQFLVKLNEIFADMGSSVSLERSSNEKVDKLISYINENIADDVSLDKLAEISYINKYYMCHMFKDNVGLSIKEYINTRRIAMAKKLLSTGEDFTTICFKCGFNDYSTFYKTFKKFTGMSPRKFLK